MKTELIALSLIGLALMSFACAEEENGSLDQRGLSSETILYPKSANELKNARLIFPYLGEYDFYDIHSKSCHKYFNINQKKIFIDSDYVVIAKDLEIVETLQCEGGRTEAVYSMKIESVFGDKPIQSTIIAQQKSRIFNAAEDNLMGLKEKNGRFYVLNSIPVRYEKNFGDPKCAEFFISPNQSVIQSSYTEYQKQQTNNSRPSSSFDINASCQPIENANPTRENDEIFENEVVTRD